MSTVRIQEPFVLYRSYLWMSLLPAALPALLGSLRPRWAMGLLCAATVALIPPFIDRLRSFSSEFSLWDDAVRKNSDATAPLVERSYRNRGVALYTLEKYEAALADFDRALGLDPRSVQAWMTRGTLFMRTAQAEKALADFDRALQLDARDAETLGRRCIVLLRLRRYDEALQDCRSARDLHPYDPLNHTSLGMVHALRGEVFSAEEEYRRAIALDPALGDPHYQYAILLNGVSRTGEARQHFIAACRAGNGRACDAVRRGGAAP
jgi:tetratricopeptide (TPR) repeat protein